MNSFQRVQTVNKEWELSVLRRLRENIRFRKLSGPNDARRAGSIKPCLSVYASVGQFVCEYANQSVSFSDINLK